VDGETVFVGKSAAALVSDAERGKHADSISEEGGVLVNGGVA
jgi:hypothetical protein